MIRRSSDKWLLLSQERSIPATLIEKEKFVRDLYIALFKFWGLQALEDMAREKNRHLLTLIAIADRYGIANPIEGLAIGQFNSSNLQTAYDNYVVQGTDTAYKGLRILGLLEERSIELLTINMNATNKLTLKEELRKIREDSFTALQRIAARIETITGTDYVAQVLTQGQVNFILGKT